MRFGFKSSSRYELRGELAAGAMGIVYRGLDKTTGQEVALKTLREDQDADALRRFHEECKKLAGLPVHPNLIEIRDVAEIVVNGITKPFLIMPLIQGQPLSDVLAKGRLPVARAIDIILQMCRGLQAAHDSGVIHRDLKPSNIFVLDDDSIKLIDFGLAHFADAQLKSTLGAGTPLYRAPEQVLRRQLTPASDLFAAGVVAYEMLSGRPPFSGETDAELDEQICRSYPAAVSTYNLSVDETTSRVIHKAIAKLPDHRFASARVFAETLDRAARGQKIDVFDPARIQPRLKRASDAYDRGELEYARELVDDLADEHLGDDIWRLRAKIEQRARDQRVDQLVETARARMEEGEFTIALRSIQEARQIDQSNREVRLLQQEILNTQSQEDIERWRELARQHLVNYRFDHAREALGHVLEKRPHDESAERALSEIRKIEAEYLRTLQQKQQLYESAVGDFDRGHIGTALGKIKRVLDLDGQAPERSDPQEASRYQKFFREVSAEQDALNASEAQVKKLESSSEFAEALRICDQVLSRFPAHAVFEGLRLRVEDRQRQELSSFIVDVDRRIQDEIELSRQLAIAADARARFPGEQHFVRRYEIIRRKKELVDGTIAKAKSYEEAQMFSEAAAELRSLREICPQYPDLDFQLQRLERRRAQQEQAQRKAELLEEIELKLEAGDADGAAGGIRKARLELGADPDWDRLEARTADIMERRQHAELYFAQARAFLLEDKTSEGLAAMRAAAALDPGNQSIRRYFLGALLAAAKKSVHDDWRLAEPLLDEALTIDPNHEFALSLRTIVEDTKREAIVAAALARVSELEEGNPRAAFESLGPALETYPNEPRLNQAKSRLVRRNGPAIKRLGAAAGDGEGFPSEAPPPAAETSQPRLRRRLKSRSTRTDERPVETKGGLPVGNAIAVDGPDHNAGDATRQPSRSRFRRVPVYAWAIAGIAVLAIGSAGIYRWTHAAPAKTRLVAGGHLRIRVTPPEAQVFVNGEEYRGGELYTLKPGIYRVEARLAAYETKVIERAEVRAGETLPLDLTLTRSPLAVVLETNLDTGKVRIDAEPERDMAGGLMPLPTLAPGPHSLTFNDGQHAFTLAFTVNNNAPAGIDRAVKASSLILLAANSHAGQTTLFTSKPGISVQFDDGPAVKLDATGINAPSRSGTHKLTVIDGGDRWDKPIQFGPESRLSIHAFASVDRGSLVVNAGVDDATVWVDTRPNRILTKNGAWKQSLRVGPHTIVVTKDGFERPLEQKVEIKRGGEVSSTFSLKPLVTVGVLHLKSTPGAEVSIDGRSHGTVPASGSLILNGLNTGSVNVRVTKRGHSPAERSFQITIGENSYELAAGVQLPGRARLPALPAGAKVTYHRKGDSTETVFEGPVKDLPEGEYVFSATAPGYLPVRNFPLTIVADADNAVPFNLEREPTTAPAPARSGMQGWPADAFRQEDDGWYAGSRAGLAMYQASSTTGIYSLQIQSPGSRKLKMFGSNSVELYAAYEDPQNHLTLRLEEKRLSCVWVESGHNKSCGEVPLAKSDQHSIRLELSKTKVQIWVDGKSMAPIESAAVDFASGKFAIKSEPGKLRIKDFRYEAR